VKVNIPQENHKDHPIHKEHDGLLFSQLYGKLPTTLSQAVMKEVSVPIAFVSLLHLANEKVRFHLLIFFQCFYDNRV